MAYFLFRFHFQEINSTLQEAWVECYGSQFSTPLKKSWSALRYSDKYREIRGLRPSDISIFKIKRKKPQGYLPWEQRLPKILTGPQAAALLTKSS